MSERKRRIDDEAVAKALEQGATFKEALLAGGHSLSNALRGRAAISNRVWDKLAERGIKLRRIAKRYDADAKAEIVQGALLENIFTGRDRAPQSLKLLGQSRDVNLFTPESNVGLVILQAPHNFEQVLAAAAALPEDGDE